MNWRLLSFTFSLTAFALTGCVSPAPYSLEISTSTKGVCDHVWIYISAQISDFRVISSDSPDILLTPDSGGTFMFGPEQTAVTLRRNQPETVRFDLTCQQNDVVFMPTSAEYSYDGGSGPLVTVKGDAVSPSRLAVSIRTR